MPVGDCLKTVYYKGCTIRIIQDCENKPPTKDYNAYGYEVSHDYDEEGIAFDSQWGFMATIKILKASGNSVDWVIKKAKIAIDQEYSIIVKLKNNGNFNRSRTRSGTGRRKTVGQQR